MARHQDRTWNVMPAPRRMIWKTHGHEIPIEVMAFAFDGDQMVYVTVHGTVVNANEVGTA
jgi:hypothetical protein